MEHQTNFSAIDLETQKLGLSSNRIKRVSMHAYKNVISRVEKTFVLEGGAIHWSNLGRIKPPFLQINVHYNNGRVGWWPKQFHNLPADDTQPIYLLTEDCDKYWVYEGFLPEIILFIGELVNDDFYLVDKKMQWLASEHHHAGVVFAGTSLAVERFSYDQLTLDTFGPYSQEYQDFKRGKDIIRQSPIHPLPLHG